MTPGTRVTILWLDASYQTDETAPPAKIPPTDLADQLVLTAGFWLGEDEHSIAIAHEWYPYATPTEARGVYRIPVGMVVRIAEEKPGRISKRNKSFRLPQRTV